MPIEIPVYSDRFPWWGGDLQTIRNQFMSRDLPLSGPESSLTFPTSDNTGDVLTATLNQPDSARPGPVLVLIHGLTGSEDSSYVRETARFQLGRGRRVVRLNLRGAGSSRRTSGGYYFGGCTADIQDVVDGLPQELKADGIFVIGYSLGGNILLNYLSTINANQPVVGAATVSAPIRPREACDRLMECRNWLYHRVLLGMMKREALSPHARLAEKERRAIQGARTMYEFDDRFTAPHHGYADAPDYYARTAGEQFVPRLPLPTLMLHARNDPWVPVAPYADLSKQVFKNAKIVIARGGGHVGFHDAASRVPWHDRVIDQFVTRLGQN